VRAPVLVDGETAIIGRDAAAALGVGEGEMVRVKA
jgi:arginine N-succinyltransferase